MGRTTYFLPDHLRAVLPPIVTGLAYYAAAVTALALTKGQDGIATIWPSSGVLLSALLASSRRHARWHIGAAALASLVANLGLNNSLLISVGFTAANMMESSFAAWLLLRRRDGRISFADPAGLVGFCLAATIATIASASIAACFVPPPSLVFWFSWFSTDLLGILVVTPLVMIVGGTLRKTHLRPESRTISEVFAIFAMVATVCGATFAQSSFPLLFLPMLSILVAVFRLGPLGAAGGVLIAAVTSSVAISFGSGPVVLIDAGSLTRSLFLQFYLLALFAASLPIAALLAAQRRLLSQLNETVRLLQLAEGAANVGHWRLDIEAGAITWSREVYKIHGLEGDTPPPLDDAINAYHPDDRQLVTGRLEKSIEHQQGFEFTARIIRPDGEIRHVLSRGEFDRDGIDRPVGLFGIIQDITSQVAYEEDLRAAGVRAEQAAKQATIMAETDQLTGIANRRRVSLALEQAIACSEETGRPLAVAIFDIDHFKQVNDRFGHHVGDQVIKRVAADAGRELRGNDTLGRFGGEEFVIVLPHASADIAMMVGERVRKAIESGGSDPSVTISIGVAELAPGENSETLLRRADQALYGAKNDGRNALRLAA